MTVPNSDPRSSHDSTAHGSKLAAKLRARIAALAQAAGAQGLTQNETAALIPEHRHHSITPRFCGLERRGEIVRVYLGQSEGTKRRPAGSPRFVSRFDPQTKKNVNVYWTPEHAPVPAKKEAARVEQPTFSFPEKRTA